MPRCSLCQKDFDLNEGGGLIKFEKQAWDLEWDKMMAQERIIGQPPYARRFCGQHYSEALDYQHLAVDEAMRLLQERIGPKR